MAMSRKNKGFTLIGVVVATSIAGFLVIVIIQLLTRADRIVDRGRNIFIATNIAREGLELVRAKRDTNWFSNSNKNLWLDKGLCAENGNDYTDRNRTFVIDSKMVRNNNGVRTGEGFLYIQPNGEWSHDPLAGKTPVYSRQITIDCSTKNDDPAYITVTSKVKWNTNTGQQELTLKEKLYNWYVPPVL